MSKAAYTRYTSAQLAISDLVGLGALQLAALLVLVDWRLAAVPLLLYLAFTSVAPLLHRLPYFLPITSHGPRSEPRVALTFDDGPDPDTTLPLLALLKKRDVHATFFLVGDRVRKHPELVSAILEAGHEVGNHSDHHDPWLMLRSRRRLAADLADCQEALASAGVHTRVFRPPVGITNPRLRKALKPLNLRCVTFDCRARDRGNRRIRHLAKRILRRVQPGSIVLLHDRAPKATGGVEAWLSEVDAVIDGLERSDLTPVRLGELLGLRVSFSTGTTPSTSTVQTFYDDLAPRYDSEQDQGGGSALRQVEQAFAQETLSEMIQPDHRVLELGAGTGRFTVPLARRAHEVVAVDLSPRMLAQLQGKLAAENLTNVHLLAADLTRLPLQDRYDAACSFSTLEYIPDLVPVLRSLASQLRPGGVLYLTTAHRCLLRWFVQIGHSLRQGVWLHARSRRSVNRALADAGFEVELTRTHFLRLGPFGGLLLEVKARAPDSPH